MSQRNRIMKIIRQSPDRLCLALAVVTGAFTWTAYGGTTDKQLLDIESAQREFQFRYQYVRAARNYTSWPEQVYWPCCPCGRQSASENPTNGCHDVPQYPADGFYQCSVEEYEFCIKLVQDLAEKFFTSSPIYGEFVKGGLEGKSSVTRFVGTDFDHSCLTNLTAGNFQEKLRLLKGYIADLRQMEVSASITNMAWRQGYPGQPYPTYEEARAAAISVWNNSSWLEPPPPVPEFEIVGEQHWTRGFGDALIQATRGRLTCQLEAFSSGSGAVFLQCGPLYDGAANNPPVTADGLFHNYGSAALGMTWVSDSLLADEQPAFTTPYPVSLEDITGGGWQLQQAVVLVTLPSSPNSGDPGECDGCGGDSCTAGRGNLSTSGGVAGRFNLGRGGFGISAGSIYLHEEAPSTDLATPRCLRTAVSDGVTVKTDAQGLRQAWAPQALADVVVLETNRYELRFYLWTEAGSVGGDDLYHPSGTPYVTYTIENPGAETNTLRITETRGSDVQVSEFVWEAVAQEWSLTRPGGLAAEAFSKTWDAGRINRTEVFLLKAGTEIVSRESATYHVFPWGEEVVTNTIGTNGSSLTTSYAYFDDVPTNDVRYGRAKWTIDPYGRWEAYQYSTNHHLNTVTVPLGDAPVGATNNVRVTAYTYSANNPILTVVEKLVINGQETEISRRYSCTFSNATWEVQCQTPGANWDASNNLTTITWKQTAGDPYSDLTGVRYPDGTMTLFTYSTNAGLRTTLTRTGVPNPAGTAIVAGTLYSNVINEAGTTLVDASYDIESGLLVSWSTTTGRK